MLVRWNARLMTWPEKYAMTVGIPIQTNDFYSREVAVADIANIFLAFGLALIVVAVSRNLFSKDQVYCSTRGRPRGFATNHNPLEQTGRAARPAKSSVGHSQCSSSAADGMAATGLPARQGAARAAEGVLVWFPFPVESADVVLLWCSRIARTSAFLQP